MLITTCTNCLARFRVTPQQLNLRQGQVRCGRCGKIFSGFEALERVPDDDTGSRLLAAREAAGTLGELPPASVPSEELPELEAIDAPFPPASGPGRDAHAPRAEERVPDLPLAEALDLGPPHQPVSRAWSFGVVLMLLVLACEGVFALRAPIAQRLPELRPWLESACVEAGCNVPWSRDEQLLKLEDSDLQEIPGRPGEIALSARIHNLAGVAQEYPYLELSLTDPTGQLAGRRVLRPTDYLGRRAARGEALAAGALLAIQLRLATPRIKPTGYELLLFYP
jgi:predicted Zn finger-like uncharacterized protein